MANKKLIEVALPLEAINKESAREKSIRHGHPSTLHLWWARRPLAAARAVIWSSLVDDPSSHPEEFPTEEAQAAERERLFRILEKLVVWENSNNPDVLDEAKAEIMKSTGGNPPALLDPFAGGGAIPLEAQRLGLEAHAHDLNPVAVMINKAMIEIPPKFAGQPPVHPGATVLEGGWRGAAGLAEDVRYYGEWMKREAFKRIGHLYPKVKDEQGKERTVIAWIWARTVKCPNPACGCEMPLVKSFHISQRKGKEVWIEPSIKDNRVRFTIRHGPGKVPEATVDQKIHGARCIYCGSHVGFDYLREAGFSQNMGLTLLAAAAERQKEKIYISGDSVEETINSIKRPPSCPSSELPDKALGFRIQQYGMKDFADLFSNRQLNMLTCFSELINEAAAQIAADTLAKGYDEEKAQKYANAVAVYLAFSVDRLANYGSSQCLWDTRGGTTVQTFGRQALSFIWNFSEANPFSNTNLAGTWTNAVEVVAQAVDGLACVNNNGYVEQQNAMDLQCPDQIMISTDPPYYDNIGYADLSDFFYLWLRHSLKHIFPSLFRTIQVPKSEELIANPFRFARKEEAREYFETGMQAVFKKINRFATGDIPVTVYYAFKQSETENENTASTGWETMLSAIIRSGFSITGTWPIRTENPGGLRVNNRNALASSIVLVCRKRPADAPMCTRRDFINALKRELKPALQKLQASSIAPVDLAQSAIGPGMGVYSRYSQVLEADGKPMSVRAALQAINQELDLYFNEQDGELDRESRFCVELYTQRAFNDIKFGEADVLARAKNTSVDKLRSDGVLSSEKGVVRLLPREELPREVDTKKGIWLLTQQLTRAMETDGVDGAAKIAAGIFTSEPERAKALAYRLFSLAERRGWTGEAFAYNSLIVAWPDVQSRATDMSAAWRGAEQQSLFQE